MSNILTDTRRALVQHLEENLQSGRFRGNVLSGRRDGTSRDRYLACVFVPAIGEWGQNVHWATPPFVVRAWVPSPKTPSPTAPTDPEPLEQLMVDLMETLQPVQTTLVDGIYLRVAQIVPDYEDWGVEATLTSWTRNPADVVA